MCALKRRDASVSLNGETGRPLKCTLEGRVTSLWEFLVEDKYDDGSPRLPGTLTVFREGGMFKGCLNDRDGGLVAFVSASSLTGLLEALEAGLVADELDWRAGQSKGRPRQKGT